MITQTAHNEDNTAGHVDAPFRDVIPLGEVNRVFFVVRFDNDLYVAERTGVYREHLLTDGQSISGRLFVEKYRFGIVTGETVLNVQRVVGSVHQQL